MDNVVRFVESMPIKSPDIFKSSPYEYEATAPVGQTIILVTATPLSISGAIVRNPLSSPDLLSPSDK